MGDKEIKEQDLRVQIRRGSRKRKHYVPLSVPELEILYEPDEDIEGVFESDDEDEDNSHNPEDGKTQGEISEVAL